jgi:hypothetical protein
MATNPMLWVGYPNSYTAGRARPVQFVTLHYTAGSEGPTSAEGGASYDKTRTDGTSCHAFFDSQGPGLQEVPFGDRSHSAYFRGNEIGVHFEICGTIQTRAQWLDATSMATLKTCAQAVAYTCDTLGLPRRRLSVAETRAAYYNPVGSRPKGINDHWTITQAFPEDNGSHSDVGPEFPWDVFMDMVGGSSPTPTTRKVPGMFRLIDPENKQFVIAPDTLSKTGWSYVLIADPGKVQGWALVAAGIGTANGSANDPNHDPHADNTWRPTSFGPTKSEVREQFIVDTAAKVVATLPPGQGGTGPTLEEIVAAVRKELDKTNVPSVPGNLKAV